MTESQQRQVFRELVEHTLKKARETFASERVDDVLLGSVIASTVKSGCALIGLNSDGVNHHLRFEDLTDHSRLLFRLTHLSEDVTVARVQGHLGHVVFGYGERAPSFTQAALKLRAETTSLFAGSIEPGVVSFAADKGSGYVYAQISLLLDLGRYIRQDLGVELERLTADIESVVEGLRKVLRGRIAAQA